MSLVRWNPSLEPFAESDEVTAQFPSIIPSRAPARSFVPPLDVYEEKESVIVETPLAGIDPEQVEVSVSGGVLSIKGSTQKEHEIEEKNYYRKEVRSGSFFRQVPLPVEVIETEVVAEFENGILRITCPKAKGEGPKKIDVKVVKKGRS